MPTYLDPILAEHRRRAERGRGLPGDGEDQAWDPGPVRPFAEALARAGGVAVIAEVKRRSPSKGDLAPGLDPSAIAHAYEQGGAACVSVLTDERFFGGSPEHLRAARRACSLPLLRKDFTVCEDDVREARQLGADAVLLIVAALDDAELGAFSALAAQLGLDALVEVHDEAELERALAAGATLVGVNQRDLTTFEVDRGRALRLAAVLPDDVVSVAESGITGPDDVARLHDAGYHAVLVGESLVTSADPVAAVRALRAAGAGGSGSGR